MNKQQLEEYCKEVAGGDPDLAGKMLEILGSKEDAANRFLSGFEGRKETTRRFQEAATTKKQAEELIGDYESRLTAADERIKAIMKDAANDKISSATANARLQVVKEKYSLTDDDIPSNSDVRFTTDKGIVPKDTGIDIDARLKTFEDDLMKRITDKLVPEMSGLAAMPIVWGEINAEHQSLTGKRLTKAEQADIMKEARSQNKSLEEVWSDKHDIPAKREEVSDASKKAKWRDEWDKAEQAKRTEEVLTGGSRRDGVEMVPDSQRSPLLAKKFKPQFDEGDGKDTRGSGSGSGVEDHQDTGGGRDRSKLTGAERAEQNFKRRRAEGIGWGQPEKKAS